MPPPPRGPRQQPATDIDRFLQEVDRLRRRAADEVPRPQPRPDTRFDDVLEVLPAAAPPPPVARARKPRRFDDVEVVPVAQPAPRPVPPPPRPTSTAFPITGVETVATISTIASISRPSAPEAAGQGNKGPSAATTDVLAILRRGNIRSAVILREILDAPRSRRSLR